MDHCPGSMENEISGQYMLQSHPHFGLVIVFISTISLLIYWTVSVMPSSSSSNPHNYYNYDVFLSFRGDNTLGNFTSHLYYALSKLSIPSLMTNLAQEMEFQSHLWMQLKYQPFQLSLSQKAMHLPGGVLMNLWRSSNTREWVKCLFDSYILNWLCYI